MISLYDVLGAGGLFAQRFPGYQERPGQLAYAQACLDAFRNGEILIGEAPTGTGKSVAALVPALLEIQEHGGKLVYVTAKIALQEQLMKKDLPQLRELLPFPFSYEIAKGFANYACSDLLGELDAQIQAGQHKGPELELLRQLVSFEWERGDLTEFPRALSAAQKRLVTIPSEDCLGKRCQYLEGCYPRAARKAYGSADVIVTNYSLYFIDLVVKANGGNGLLPQHRLLVLDEVHNAGELSRKHFGQRFSLGTLKVLLHDLRASGRRAEKLGLPRDIAPQLRDQAEQEAERFFWELDELIRSKRYSARLDEPGMVDGARLEELLFHAGAAYVGAAMRDGLAPEAREFLRERAEGLAKRIDVIKVARQLDREGWIAYVEGEPGGKLELAAEPISAGPFLRSQLFQDRTGAKPQGIVLASATLTVPQGREKQPSFDYSAKQLGLECREDRPEEDVPGVAEIIVESPFDFSRCALVVPKGLPDPQDREWPAEVAETLVTLCGATDGAVLGLFTSYRVMELAAKRLRAARPDLRVLVQGEPGAAPLIELVRIFREDKRSVLLGTDSLWEGVDVPGESCIGVLIDRIPFDHMDDPVLDAIRQQDKDWFRSYQLPKAALAFKQGFGRLIRSTEDYGVVVCCDPRITGKGYGAKFKRSVPEACRFSERLSDIPGLLAEFRVSAP